MSIKNVLALAKQIQAKWTQNVVNARPGEQSQLLPYLGALTTYATVSAEMAGWVAAPGIWIAWITSKKLNALNRVFSDYEYKSAAALAYESYRQTVAEAGSDELKQQLLAFAIRSFGENPTHYYESVKNEASSPFESFLEKIPFLSKNKSDFPKNSL